MKNLYAMVLLAAFVGLGCASDMDVQPDCINAKCDDAVSPEDNQKEKSELRIAVEACEQTWRAERERAEDHKTLSDEESLDAMTAAERTHYSCLYDATMAAATTVSEGVMVVQDFLEAHMCDALTEIHLEFDEFAHAECTATYVRNVASLMDGYVDFGIGSFKDYDYRMRYWSQDCFESYDKAVAQSTDDPETWLLGIGLGVCLRSKAEADSKHLVDLISRLGMGEETQEEVTARVKNNMEHYYEAMMAACESFTTSNSDLVLCFADGYAQLGLAIFNYTWLEF